MEKQVHSYINLVAKCGEAVKVGECLQDMGPAVLISAFFLMTQTAGES